MAWRIDEAVVRGEIDNRTKGRVVGRIWFVGVEAPVQLDLEGNAWRDVAGRVLKFENPAPKTMDLSRLSPTQSGVVGDITASRKVKVPEIPMDQIGEYYAAKKPWPWHWGNSLYLEWFSLRNGRVVIESSSFELTMEDEPTWEMSEDEEAAQRVANGEALTGFMQGRVDALDEGAGQPDSSDDTPVEWSEDKPMTEAEAEAEQARQDLLLDRVQARIEREGKEVDFETILEEEIERLREERGEPPLGEGGKKGWEVDESILAEIEDETCGELDTIWLPQAHSQHPLVEQAHDLWLRLHELAEKHEWIPPKAMVEHPVVELINATMCVGPKLAGALNGDRWPPEIEFCAQTIVRLKRARGYVDDALGAAESCQEDRLIPPEHLGPATVDLIDLAHEIDQLIGELRDRLEAC